jgi:hypothetical protein
MRRLRPLTHAFEEVEVVDASTLGARIRVQTNLPVNTAIQIIFDKSILVAEVRYCVPVAGSFEAGLRVSVFYSREPESPDSLQAIMRPLGMM